MCWSDSDSSSGLALALDTYSARNEVEDFCWYVEINIILYVLVRFRQLSTSGVTRHTQRGMKLKPPVGMLKLLTKISLLVYTCRFRPKLYKTMLIRGGT